MQTNKSLKLFSNAAGWLLLLSLSQTNLFGQQRFHAWLSTCSHLVGPTGNPKTLGFAIDQSRGKHANAPSFDWDIMIDVGDWTASQAPPHHEEGLALAQCLENALGEDRGRFFTVSGNHDGEAKDWQPGEFTQKYINPLGEAAFSKTSRFDHSQRPDDPDLRQLREYPGTRWDRYLVRTGNVLWIMLGDRNEFDYLALSRNDLSGTFQAGRGSAAGMPKGGYPSGSVTLDTFEWWKKVVEDPAFSSYILMTAHHHMPAFTTITTDDGEPGNYHGKSGSLGPRGETGGQLYWIREYDEAGKEINQYAQTRPFLNYLRDHPGAIAAWIGGHTHIHGPESSVNERGAHVRKYGTTFISVGALTSTHAGGRNQMTRMLTFEEGSDKALLNIYVHHSQERLPVGWIPGAVRTVPLGKKFVVPVGAKNGKGPDQIVGAPVAPEAPEDPAGPRYRWSLNQDQTYDFNNDQFIVGEDGSPYGRPFGSEKIHYADDTPSGKGRSLDLGKTKGPITFNAPFTPEMNWKTATVSIQVKLSTTTPTEILAHGATGKPGKFKLSYDGKAFVWEVGEGKRTKSIRSTESLTPGWHLLTGIVDANTGRIQLYVDGVLSSEKKWKGKTLHQDPSYQLVLGAHKNPAHVEALVDELEIYDTVVLP